MAVAHRASRWLRPSVIAEDLQHTSRSADKAPVKSPFVWRPTALLLLASLSASLAAPRSGSRLTWHACTHALVINGLVYCNEALVDALQPCAPGQTVARVLRSGDALTCQTSQGLITHERADPPTIEALNLPVDLNRATAAELMTLPLVGEKRAQAIVAARPIRSWDEVDAWRGVGDKGLATLRQRARLPEDFSTCLLWQGAGVKMLPCVGVANRPQSEQLLP